MDRSITILTDHNDRNTHSINTNIRKIVKEISAQNTPSTVVVQHLECIKNLLQKPQYRESYPNIGPLFESQEGFDALKEVLLFEYNQMLGITTYENIDILSAMKTLRYIFIKNNDEASKIERNITNIDQSIKLQKRDSEESKAEFQKILKKESKTNPIIKLLRFLFKKIINKIFEEIEKEQLRESKKKLNGLKDQFHKVTDSFNKELNSLIDAYEKGIKSSNITEVSHYDATNVISNCSNQRESEYITYRSNYNTVEEIFSEQRELNTQQKLLQPYSDATYVSAEEVRRLKKQQKSTTKELKSECRIVDYSSKHIQIYDSPKSQTVQISEIGRKPQILLKHSKVIQNTLSKNNACIPNNRQNRIKELSVFASSKTDSSQKLESNNQGLINKIDNKAPISSAEPFSKSPSERRSIDWNQALSESPLFNSIRKKISSKEESITQLEYNIDLSKTLRNRSLLEKVRLEEVSNKVSDKEKNPQTKLKNQKIGHEKVSSVIMR